MSEAYWGHRLEEASEELEELADLGLFRESRSSMHVNEQGAQAVAEEWYGPETVNRTGTENGFKVETDGGTQLIHVPATGRHPEDQPYVGDPGDEAAFTPLQGEVYLIGTDREGQFVQYFKFEDGAGKPAVRTADRYDGEDVAFQPRLGVRPVTPSRERTGFWDGDYELVRFLEDPLTVKQTAMQKTHPQVSSVEGVEDEFGL